MDTQQKYINSITVTQENSHQMSPVSVGAILCSSILVDHAEKPIH